MKVIDSKTKISNTELKFMAEKMFGDLVKAVVDYFFADNQYKSTDRAWQKYFRAFNWMANLP